MLGTIDLPLFVVAGLLLNVTPGPDTLYIVGRSTLQGFRAGATAALGIGAGAIVHTVAAAVGLSAVLAASATAFTIVKWLGAAYLVYVGISLLLSRPKEEEKRHLEPAGLRTVFLQGFFTNVLNPKVALFFLAFLPQFVDPAAPSKALALFFLGLVFNFNGTLWNLFVAWSSARVASTFRGAGRFALWFNRAAGGLFVYLGVRLAVSK